MKPIRETLKDVVTIFASYHGCLNIPAQRRVKAAAKEIQRLIDNTGLSDEDLKKQTDLIIAGVIIDAMACHHEPYAREDYLYPIPPSDVFKGFTEGMSDLEKWNHLGNRALVAQDLPFTGIFDETFGVGHFLLLREPLKDHFKSYQLNTDPKTMNPDALNKPGRVEREQNEAIAKWLKPFGQGPNITTSRSQEFLDNRQKIMTAINAQESRYSTELWKWRGLVVLACVLAPLTLITGFWTIPGLINKRAKIQSEYDGRTWREITFTRDEYDAVRDKRRALKATFTDTEKTKTNSDKPHKVCLGFDKRGERTPIRENITAVKMLCDKEQMKRWSPRFLATATQETYNQSVQESVRLNQATI